MVKKPINTSKTKAPSPSTRKANLKVDLKKAASTITPRLAGNHNQILL